MSKFNKPLVLIFLLGLLLRLLFLSQFPSGFSADEVNQGYSAYSILNTGRDEWGEFMPIAPRSYGDYRAPMYTYLVIPSIALFGLNEFAVRLPNAIFGSLTILVLFYLAREIFREKVLLQIGSKKIILSEDISYFVAILMAINPWSISLSRGAFEPNLPVFLVPFGWLLFEIAVRKKSMKYMTFASLVFGLSLFSYYSARFFVPLFVLVLILKNVFLDKNITILRRFKSRLVLFLLFIAVALYTMFVGGGTRSGDVAIFNPTGGWGSISDKRYEAVLMGLPDQFARIFSNKLTYVLETFVTQYSSYFSPQFLFTNGAGEATYGMLPGRGLFYFIEILFISFGIYLIIKNYKLFSNNLSILVFWLVASPVVAGLSKGPGFAANRAALMVVPIIFVSSIGMYFIAKLLSMFLGYKKVLLVLTVVLGISLISFCEDYIYHAPYYNSRNMSYGIGDALKYVATIESAYDEIIIDKSISEPQMFVAFYNQIDPRIVQKESKSWLEYESMGFKFVDQMGQYNLEKYHFQNIDNIYPRIGKTLYIVKYKPAFLANTILKTVNYPDGKPALQIIEVTNEI